MNYLASLENGYEPRWYALYLCVRHEKRIAEELSRRAVNYYLPLYVSVRRWKDRRIQLQLPLYPGYLFVHIPLLERLTVLTVPGVVNIVGTKGQAVPIPDRELEVIKNFLDKKLPVQPFPYLSAGRKMRVVRGPLEGCEGIVLRRKNDVRIVLTMELIKRSVAVEVDAGDLQPA